MSDFITEKRDEIAARIEEIRPLVAELERLSEAYHALGGPNGASAPLAPATDERSRSATPASGTRRRGRPKGSGMRGAEALALVRAQPGITIPQIAERMGIKQNYLYRVLPALADDGLVVKAGRGWQPV